MAVTDLAACLPDLDVVAAAPPPPAGPRTPLLPVVGAGLPVPLVDGGTVPYANLDYAASAPALQAVADQVARVLPSYASVHRGAGFASQVSTRLYEGARASVSRFVGARADDVVIFTRNTTDSLNLLAGCLPEKSEVVVLDIEHHATLLPWRDHVVRVVPAAATLHRTVERVDAELRRRPAAVLAVTGASNVTGEHLPIGQLTRIAHRAGARIVVDAAQLVAHRRLDLLATDVDYVAFSGHKLYAPFGAGVLVGRRDWLDSGRPYLAGGGAVREVTADDTAWAAAPARHEGGSPNVVGAAALAAACDALASVGDGCVEQHESALRRRLVAGLSTVSGVRVLRFWSDSTSPIGVVAFTVEGHDPGRVAAFLSAEHGIGVRDGRFCAHPAARRLGLGPAGALRASFGVGSTIDDVDRLVEAVRRLVTHGPEWTYDQVDGRYAPSPDPRPVPQWIPDVPSSAGGQPCSSTSA